MSSKKFQIFIGIAIILLGLLLYVFQLDIIYFRAWGELLWGTLFLLGFVIMMGLYLKLERKEFWPFLPAGGCLGLSALLLSLACGANGEFASGAMFFIFGLTFLVVYLHQRLKQFWPIFPASVLLGISVLLLSIAFGFRGEFATSMMFLLFALGFIALYFHFDRKQFWTFIPAGVFLGLSILLLLASMEYDGIALAGGFLLVIGLGFVSIYVFHRDHWWALIPGGIIGGVGVIMLLVSDEDIGVYIGSAVLIIIGIIMVFRSLTAQAKDTPALEDKD